MADDRIRRDQDDLDLEDDIMAEEGGVAELSEGEIDEEDDSFDLDDEDD
jgi:hypothetical protein